MKNQLLIDGICMIFCNCGDPGTIPPLGIEPRNFGAEKSRLLLRVSLSRSMVFPPPYSARLLFRDLLSRRGRGGVGKDVGEFMRQGTSGRIARKRPPLFEFIVAAEGPCLCIFVRQNHLHPRHHYGAGNRLETRETC